MRVVISSGHGKYVRGAEGLIDEVDEARRVVEHVAGIMRSRGHWVATFHDDVSTTQDENLHRIVEFHNAQTRDLDVSVHFNAYEPTDGGRGVEVLYYSNSELASRVSQAIAYAGYLINRGPKQHSDLYFLNHTEMPAILIETCFVDAAEDVDAYEDNFPEICNAIAMAVLGEWPLTGRPPETDADFYAEGRMSWFGGPADHGVSPSEGLAFIDSCEQAPHLFLLEQPDGTTGLARRLNPAVYYVACRWNYDITPKSMLRDPALMALVRAKNGREFLAWPADWGPHEDTGRVADLSKGLMEALCLTTDDVVEIIYPAPDIDDA